jgi:KDO2-lipid IV(A) lauroyltransferase
MAYIIYYLILLPLSWLPLPVLYSLGRVLYWIGYRLFGYRKQVVYENIRGSFPEWTEEQVQKLVDDNYRFFFDSMAESIKLFSMSREEVMRRCQVENPEAIEHLAKDGKSCIVMGGHYSNWEIAALAFPLQFLGHTVMGIYSPLKNETLDGLVSANRKRFGTHLVSRREVTEYFDENPVGPAVDFFIADQSPSNAAWQKVHWSPFLHRNTRFLAGPERYAVRYDRPVYYITLRRQRRGHYVARLIPVTETPRETAPGFITEAFVRQLEKEILRDPAPWLWTHRRWKRGEHPEAMEAMQGKPYLAAEYDRELRGSKETQV